MLVLFHMYRYTIKFQVLLWADTYSTRTLSDGDGWDMEQTARQKQRSPRALSAWVQARWTRRTQSVLPSSSRRGAAGSGALLLTSDDPPPSHLSPQFTPLLIPPMNDGIRSGLWILHAWCIPPLRSRENKIVKREEFVCFHFLFLRKEIKEKHYRINRSSLWILAM